MRIRNLLVVVSLLTLALAGGMWSVSLAADDDSGSIKALEPSLIDQVDSLTVALRPGGQTSSVVCGM